MSFTFTLSLTIPKATPARAPVLLTVNSGLPVVESGRVSIPTGPVGLAYVRLRTRAMPIFPVDGTYLNGDGELLDFAGYWRMDGPPWQITLEGYNLDDTYPHTISALVACGGLR